MHAVMIT